MSQDGTRIGSLHFAQGAEILDVTGSSAVKLFPSRLAGITLKQDMVTYYSLNGSGEIDRMILDDATGDAGQYGVLIGMESFGEGLYATYSYEYDLGGTIYNLPASSTGFAVSPGGIRVVGDPANPDRMYSLSEVKATGLSGYTLQAGNRTYQVAEQVVVYEYRDHQYFPSTLDRVQELGLSLTGWYDRPENQGGRIRVIVAR